LSCLQKPAEGQLTCSLPHANAQKYRKSLYKEKTDKQKNLKKVAECAKTVWRDGTVHDVIIASSVLAFWLNKRPTDQCSIFTAGRSDHRRSCDMKHFVDCRNEMSFLFYRLECCTEWTRCSRTATRQLTLRGNC